MLALVVFKKKYVFKSKPKINSNTPLREVTLVHDTQSNSISMKWQVGSARGYNKNKHSNQ